jgi:hypothetical protein
MSTTTINLIDSFQEFKDFKNIDRPNGDQCAGRSFS